MVLKDDGPVDPITSDGTKLAEMCIELGRGEIDAACTPQDVDWLSVGLGPVMPCTSPAVPARVEPLGLGTEDRCPNDGHVKYVRREETPQSVCQHDLVESVHSVQVVGLTPDIATVKESMTADFHAS